MLMCGYLYYMLLQFQNSVGNFYCKMQKAKYIAEFKEKALHLVINRCHSIIDVAKRLEIVDGLLYIWVKKFKVANEPVAIDDMKSMKAQLKG